MGTFSPRILLALLAMLCSGGCSLSPTPPLTHEMYVWQLAWTPAVRNALEQTAPMMAGVHVLALEVDPRGEVREPSLDLDALRRTSQPLVAVVRIDGCVKDLPQAQEHIRNLLQRWRDRQLAMQALEIDFDCGTFQLDAYARFLAGLRPLLPAGTRLMITALPAWMASQRLPELARVADEVVLQVHSVSNPRHGLFDPDQAYAWIEQYARRATAPFKVALPTYGSKVQWDDNGRIASVVSETRASFDAGTNRELAADPETIAAFLRRLSRRPVKGLSGIVWFRMPTDADQRAWSVPTFLAVVRSEPLNRSVNAKLQPRGTGGDIVIANTGTLDAPVPRAIRLKAACREADAVSGYTLQRRDGSLQWVRAMPGMMRAGTAVSIGWANCDNMEAGLEVSY